MFLKKNLEAFTLVELIVVITIVGILSTVGFVSYSGYLTGARDSNRVSQMTKLSDSLQVYAASKTLPLPDDAINITASGSANIIGYQGYIGVDVLETIDYTNGGKDPKDDSYYTYYLTKDRKNMQLLVFMEDAASVANNVRNIAQVSKTHAVNYEDRFPKVYGKKLGVLTEPLTNTPVQELSSILSGSGYLDIVKTTASYKAIISEDEVIIGTGGVLMGIGVNASCKRIKQIGGGGDNGMYTISPQGIDLTVYCDMETNGGGWTLIARSAIGGSGNFGLGTIGSLSNLNLAYKIHPADYPVLHTDLMLGTYNSGRDIVSFKSFKISSMVGLSLAYTFESHTLEQGGITGGTTGDLYNGKQGMLFVK